MASMSLPSTRTWIIIAIVVLVLAAVGWFFRHAIRNFFGAGVRTCAAAVGTDLSAEILTANDGSPWPIAAQRGKVLLLVNTASQCGFTKQYDGLEALWQRFREQGLVVAALPTNDFLGQEPGGDAEIAEFCRRNHGVTFPLLAKTTTRGAAAPSLLRRVQDGGPLPGQIGWNFEKILIDRAGRLRGRVSTRIAPEDPRLIAAIEALLAEPAP
jgi:glutathione peroxidase